MRDPVKFYDQDDGVVKFKFPEYAYFGDGGPFPLQKATGSWCCRKGGVDTPTSEHLKEGFCQGQRTGDEMTDVEKENKKDIEGIDMSMKPTNMDPKEYIDYIDKLKNNVRTEIPSCQCFPSDSVPPEPGTYYTHLGAAKSLSDLMSTTEKRTGLVGKAIRIEKIVYTGKEGKTTAGCPLAKWIIRRGSIEEKLLMVVKHRPGHTCSTAWIVVVVVAWEGVPSGEADVLYSMLTYKLNKFGLPTTRRCATNEPRTCACQGLDPDSCGASFSFGCSWSMYYNGCKFARSKSVRKYRLTVKTEEKEVEDRMESLATILAPLYKSIAPDSFKNQIQFEKEAFDCRLGLKVGRPFSGVTACFDFCAHAHRDLHNMNNGCTVVVSLTKHKTLSKPDDEQLHVLPLYIMDDSDEFGDKEAQKDKIKNGALESLSEFPCEVRVRAVPLAPCRRKKRKSDEDQKAQMNVPGIKGGIKVEKQWDSSSIQIGKVSSTVNNDPSHKWPLGGPLPKSQAYNQSFHTSSYHGSWSSLNLNDGLPLDDQIKREPDCGQTSVNPFQAFDTWQKGFYGPSVQAYKQIKKELNSLSDHNYTESSHRSKPIKQEIKSTQGQESLSFSPANSVANFYNFPTLQPPKYFHHTPILRETQEDYNPNKYYHKDPSSENFTFSHNLYRQPLDKTSTDSNITSAMSSVTPERSHEPAPHKNIVYQKESNITIKEEPSCPKPQDFPTHFKPSPYFEEHCYPRHWERAQNPPFGPILCYDNALGYQPPLHQTFSPNYYQGVGSGQQFFQWSPYGPNPYLPPPEPKTEPIGHVSTVADNKECFMDSQIGGVAIALGHGSVLFECAKHELHATTALKRPDRKGPSRISLVFYQHRNLNKSNHGADQWQEKMRLRKAASLTPTPIPPHLPPVVNSSTFTTNTWTTLFPMHPCTVSGAQT